jgi:hypothetical protein
MAIFDKNGGCVAIDHRPEARTPHPTYVSLPYITFSDFCWRPFLVKNPYVLAFSLHDGSLTTTYGWLLKRPSATYGWSLKTFCDL